MVVRDRIVKYGIAVFPAVKAARLHGLLFRCGISRHGLSRIVLVINIFRSAEAVLIIDRLLVTDLVLRYGPRRKQVFLHVRQLGVS